MLKKFEDRGMGPFAIAILLAFFHLFCTAPPLSYLQYLSLVTGPSIANKSPDRVRLLIFQFPIIVFSTAFIVLNPIKEPISEWAHV
jgi:hypothetical protein